MVFRGLELTLFHGIFKFRITSVNNNIERISNPESITDRRSLGLTLSGSSGRSTNISKDMIAIKTILSIRSIVSIMSIML